MQLSEDFVNFRITEFPCLINVYLHAIVIFQGYLSLRNASQATTKATGCEILLYVILNSAMSRIMNQKKTGRFTIGGTKTFMRRGKNFMGGKGPHNGKICLLEEALSTLPKTPSCTYDYFMIAFPVIKLSLLPQKKHY